MHGDGDNNLSPGARIRLSALGKTRCPRIKVHTGVVIRTTDGSDAVRVLLDGRNAPVTSIQATSNSKRSSLKLKPAKR